MDNKTYKEIIKWYNQKYPRGAPGTIDNYILVKDRDGAYGTHGFQLDDEPASVQIGEYWQQLRKGLNNITKVKADLKMRWLILPSGAYDLNIIENC